MGCTTSRDAATSMPPRRAQRRRRDPAKLCRERAALARDMAGRRSALAAAHAAYFRSLVSVGGALRRFTAAALAAPPPVAASSSTTTRRHMTRSTPSVPTVVFEDPHYAEGEVRYAYAYCNMVAGERTPSPPSISPWDFFDPFAHCEGFVEDYRSRRSQLDGSPDYDELRRMEGIPELEDETAAATDAPPSFKHAGGDQNAEAKTPSPNKAALHSDTASGGANGKVGKMPASRDTVPSNSASKSNEGVKKSLTTSTNGSMPTPAANNGGKGKAVPNNSASKSNEGMKTAEKGSVPSNGSSRTNNQHKPKKRTTPASSKGTVNDNGGGINNGTGTTAAAAGGGDDGSHGQPAVLSGAPSLTLSPMHLDTKRSITAAMDEVYWLFTEAANRGVAVWRVLGKGKAVTRRARLRVALTVSSSSCLPKRRDQKSSRTKTSSSSSAGSGAAGANDVQKLSSTLEKLWVWEKKLYLEIKDKKKLRKEYKKMQDRLKSLEKQGRDSSAIDSSQMSLSLLRSKVSVSTSTVNVLSLMIEKIRDEELYPQLTDLIQRFQALWKAILETHEKQLSAILDTELHRLKAVTLSQSNVASMASEELERELKNWRQCFDKWIGSQKSFVEALNQWLKKSFPREAQEEDAANGVPQPALPAIAISDKWLQTTEKVPMPKVLRAMDHFSKLAHEFKRRQEEEHGHRQKADRASRNYYARHEELKAAFGVITDPDVVTVTENPKYRHDDLVRDLVKARRRRDKERSRHDEVLCHAHIAASTVLPFGLVPMLQEMISFFQENLQAYTQITV